MMARHFRTSDIFSAWCRSLSDLLSVGNIANKKFKSENDESIFNLLVVLVEFNVVRKWAIQQTDN